MVGKKTAGGRTRMALRNYCNALLRAHAPVLGVARYAARATRAFRTSSATRCRATFGLEGEQRDIRGMHAHALSVRVRGFASHGPSWRVLSPAEMARSFAANELLPHADHWDEHEVFPRETILKAAGLGAPHQRMPPRALLIPTPRPSAGLGGIYVKDDFGTGLSRLDAARARPAGVRTVRSTREACAEHICFRKSHGEHRIWDVNADETPG